MLGGCSVAQSFSPTLTPTSHPLPTALPSSTSVPTPLPTPTEVPYYVEATVLSFDAQVPILIYHHFLPDRMGPTSSMNMTFTEFRDELTLFYENDFVLVSLKEWVEGTYTLPPGKRPLIITIDDLWFADQLFIEEDGSPSAYSGLGILHEFSTQNPDFGFEAAVFAVYGDKYYAIKRIDDVFITEDDAEWFSPSWRLKLGNTIAWAVDNGIEIYNHTLQHRLTNIDNTEIQRQLRENDYVLRNLLDEVGREDLISQIGNIIALPEGKWPETDSGKNVVLNYKDPEGRPVLAVMEAYNLDSAQFTPSSFNPGFNRYAIPRITASPYFVKFIIENKAAIPTALSCRLGPLDPTQSEDAVKLQNLIANVLNDGSCGAGVYHVGNLIFTADTNGVSLFNEKDGSK